VTASAESWLARPSSPPPPSSPGKISATDGPFMETKEMLAGLVVIEAPDLNGVRGEG